MKKSYYYLYLIQFSDGRYYIGSHISKCKPEEDTEYMGSPVTFKQVWSDSNLSKKKYILKEVNSVEELRRIEPILIEAAWERDGLDIVLNRNSAPRFHPEVCIKGGKISGKRTHELRVGIHSLTSEEKSKAGKMGAKTTAERYSRQFIIVDPNGNIHRGTNLRKFCREHGLDSSNVRRVLNGTQLTSKGWTSLSHEFSN